MTLTLVLGGARSGKSAYALALAEALAADAPSPRALTLIATAQAFDAEMTERIARHQAERGAHWRTLEAPLALAEALDGLEARDVVVVDCLTLWLSNVMLGEHDVAAAVDTLLQAAACTRADVFFVSNEVGLSIVPDNALARRFRDEAGRLNRLMAAEADRATVLFAGLPLTLKP
ncbi:MAG: bifunctional adenosylcobinamide kinase/adenosylcobinamide-phosphate guanylyltransferase [Caulobacteraceae bacterium]